jgi:hypothetical protein
VTGLALILQYYANKHGLVCLEVTYSDFPPNIYGSVNHVVKIARKYSRLYQRLFLVIGTQEEEPWCAALEYYSTYKVDQLHPVVAKLASLVKAAPSSKLKVRQ